MPHFYTKNFRNAILAAYAREATIEAFGHRARRVLDEPDFVDRLPGEMPRPAPESWRPEAATQIHADLADLFAPRLAAGACRCSHD